MSPKVLLINYEFPPLGGGAGNATAHIAREMAAQGADVRVLTAAWRDLPRRETRDGFTVLRVRAVRRRAERCTPAEMLTFTGAAGLAALRLARAWTPDHCIAFFTLPSGPAAALLRRLRGVPYTVSLRGGDVPGFQPYQLAGYHRLCRPVIHRLWRGAAHVVANSEALRELALRSMPGLDVRVIPNGVDTNVFRPAPPTSGEPGAAQPPLRLLFVGRLTRQKGADVLLEAVRRLKEDLPVRAVLVGDGEDRTELERSAAAAGLTGSVVFEGWRDRARIAELCRESDLFVLPSRDEGMSNAILEAMASGLPVIATALDANREVVAEGETGLLVPADDHSALAAAVRRLGADPAARLRMGAAARVRAETCFSWRETARRYLDLARRRQPDEER